MLQSLLQSLPQKSSVEFLFAKDCLTDAKVLIHHAVLGSLLNFCSTRNFDAGVSGLYSIILNDLGRVVVSFKM